MLPPRPHLSLRDGDFVMALPHLPHLSDEERRGILGENAVRRMGLTAAGADR
jgi:hypothetical protein